MKGYTVREVTEMLGLPATQIRLYAATGFLSPERGSRGEYRFSFQDLVLLRTAAGLTAARISPRKVRKALRDLRTRLPIGKPLTEVRIAADGDRIVVQDGGTQWDPHSGQVLFDFAVADLAKTVAPFAKRAAEEALSSPHALSAEEWYDMGCELEITDPDAAFHAYEEALTLAPDYVDAHLNLGRLIHETGDVVTAKVHYRTAVDLDPANPTANFNLGVALEDLGDDRRAARAYEDAIAGDGDYADAHFNLAGVYERSGDREDALRHLRVYKRLMM
ncbi:MAG TPA: tetratricopeptide repeat protein [Thermoanaerobaculia bacterium]|nr:tetratricopeptide repeat protein [Thermoanaerobaculia bacterium]